MAGRSIATRWQDETDRRRKYRRYIRESSEWKAKRTLIYRRAGGRCERCKKRRPAAVHHLTYANLFDERLNELAAVCDPCHRFLHNLEDSDITSVVRSATRSDEEPFRLTRLQQVIAAIDDKRGLFDRVRTIFDHKGVLTVEWAPARFDAALAATIGVAWEDVGGEPRENVEHTFNMESGYTFPLAGWGRQ